jgi:phage tail sheath gpL-like
MGVTPESLASVNSVEVENVQFAVEVTVVKRKINIIATYDPLLTEVVDNEPIQIFNANDAGVKAGFGFMAHRLAVRAFAGSFGNVEAYLTPQPEAGGAAAAAGSADFTGSTGVKAGTVYLYIAGIPAFFQIQDGATPAEIAAAMTAAVTALADLPTTAATNLNASDLTSKSKGPWGDDISIEFNLGPGQSLPVGVVVAVADMTGGSGVPDVQDALDGLGTGDNQNEDYYTDILCGYGKDSTTLDKISAYNGIGDEKTGNYAGTVARPFRALVGDTAEGTSGLDDLLTLADGRAELDRTNGILPVPGNVHHPMELAACAIGVMARLNNIRPQQNYVNEVLPGIMANKTGRWTDDYDNRDQAVKNGVSTTQVKNNTVTLQDVITFYRPAAVIPASNGYRAMRNISLFSQNITSNYKANFEREKYQGVTIVEDKAIVGDLIDAEKTVDRDDVLDDLVDLNDQLAAKGWLFNKSFGLEKLKAEPARVTLRSSGRGFDIRPPALLSGEGGIYNTKIEFDTSLAIVLQ